MRPSEQGVPADTAIAEAAARWVLKIDRGLTPQEQDEYTEWLAANKRHLDAIALHQWGWEEFDRLAGLQTTRHARVDPDLLAPGCWRPGGFLPRRMLRRWLPRVTLAAAAVVAVFYLFQSDTALSPTPEPGPAQELIARIEKRILDDESELSLNRGAVLKVRFSMVERRVELIRGEVSFSVAKDPDRPFIVEVGGVDVRAVGTVFNVRLTDEAVDVIVTEGKVSLTGPDVASRVDILAPMEPLVGIGQRATVRRSTPDTSIDVVDLTTDEIHDALRWQPRLLDFDAAKLTQIVAAFNACNPVQLVLSDSALESVQLSSAFWSDDVEGFVRLMESSFGMQAEWVGSREIRIFRSTEAGRSN